VQRIVFHSCFGSLEASIHQWKVIIKNSNECFSMKLMLNVHPSQSFIILSWHIFTDAPFPKEQKPMDFWEKKVLWPPHSSSGIVKNSIPIIQIKRQTRGRHPNYKATNFPFPKKSIPMYNVVRILIMQPEVSSLPCSCDNSKANEAV